MNVVWSLATRWPNWCGYAPDAVKSRPPLLGSHQVITPGIRINMHSWWGSLVYYWNHRFDENKFINFYISNLETYMSHKMTWLCLCSSMISFMKTSSTQNRNMLATNGSKGVNLRLATNRFNFVVLQYFYQRVSRKAFPKESKKPTNCLSNWSELLGYPSWGHLS